MTHTDHHLSCPLTLQEDLIQLKKNTRCDSQRLTLVYFLVIDEAVALIDSVFRHGTVQMMSLSSGEERYCLGRRQLVCVCVLVGLGEDVSLARSHGGRAVLLHLFLMICFGGFRGDEPQPRRLQSHWKHDLRGLGDRRQMNFEYSATSYSSKILLRKYYCCPTSLSFNLVTLSLRRGAKKRRRIGAQKRRKPK